MRLRTLHLIVCAGLTALACTNSGSFERTADGVIVNIGCGSETTGKVVRIKPINENIIRVSASAENTIGQRSSLVIDPKLNTDFDLYTVSQTSDSVIVATEKVKAFVSLRNGAVRFADNSGRTLLAERCGGGKSFEPITVDDSRGYTVRQVFESADDDAFFGLGQHQSGEWNYKDKNEELYQYNTKASVPFVMSNKNYGLLWDNYSYSRFGDARPYAQLTDLNPTGNDGSAGLTATYTTARGEVFVTRAESTIDYENLETVKNFPAGFPFDFSTITWEGALTAPVSGEYKFKLYYAGYTQVFVDGKPIGDEVWRTAWNPNTRKFSIAMEAGRPVPVRIEWHPDGGVSYIGLKFLSPLPQSEENTMAIWSEMGQMIDYYFVYGQSMDSIVSGYRTLTGRAPILPKWAWGFWQSRERYKTQNEIVGTLKRFRDKHIPIDNIVLDWSYWEEDQWGAFTFDPARFADPKKMVDDIHAMHGHIMISHWPKYYINTDNFKELNNKGFIYQQAIIDSVRDWIGVGYIGSFYDPYSQEARDIFWRQMKDNLFSLGIDAWWMDASEPDILSNASMEYRKKLSGPTAIGSSTEYFNTYSLPNAQAIYEGQRHTDPDKRVFLLTRSGFSGLQRYSTATWSGDIATRWEDMRAQITAGLNYSVTGLPFWTMDIGGFCVEKRYERAQHLFDAQGVENEDLKEWRELNTRWHQFGAFVPLYRTHGQFPLREVFNIAPENHPAYQSILFYHKLRYSLMPYIYSLAGRIHFDNYTLMRPLPMDFATDHKVLNVSDEYMFGPGLLVNPVCQYKATSRKVYFPAGAGWYDIYNGAYLQGGQEITVDAPYERIPVYAKAGSIIPVGPDIEYAGQKEAEPITLVVYAGADAVFDLYNDEGVNYNYEKGEFARVRLTYTDASRTLTIGTREGQYSGMPKSQQFNIVLVTGEKPVALSYKAKADKTVRYSGEEIKIEL